MWYSGICGGAKQWADFDSLPIFIGIAMTRRWRHIVSLAFRGPRFEGHAIEIPALVELIRYQDLVKDLAKATFYRENPEARRLPNHFEEMLTLRFSEITEGSAVIPLEVCEISDHPQFEFNVPTYPAEKAADLIAKCVVAASEERSLPDEFPKSCLPSFVEFGKSLGTGDEIGISLVKESRKARYTMHEHAILETFLSSPYTDIVTITGKVMAADVRMLRFQLYPQDRPSVQVSFDESREFEVVRALRDHKSRVLSVRGQGTFKSDGSLMEISQVTELRLLDSSIPEITGAVPIWKQILAIAENAPAETFEHVPSDASIHLDEYLYGGKEA